ncbi:MAG TPA: hypothetical protein VGG39_30925 [Polyangiaceae bacterium]|jgi:hypothetical protein
MYGRSWGAAAAAAGIGAAVAACGGRTTLEWLIGAPAGASDGGADGETSFDGGRPASDASSGGPDSGGSFDGSPHDAALDAASVDAGPPPINPRCIEPLGLQPGSPWPIAQRCPARAGYTDAIGPSSPKVAWAVPATDVWLPEVVIAADGTIYGYDVARGVVALGSDGRTRWATAIGSPSSQDAGGTSLAIGPDGTVYAWNGWLTELAPDGTVVRQVQVTFNPASTDAQPSFELTVGHDGTVYALELPPSGAANLLAIDPTSGDVRREPFGDGETPVAAPTVGSAGDVLVVVTESDGSGWLLTFPPGGGAPQSLNLEPALQPPPSFDMLSGISVTVGDDGTLYVPCLWNFATPQDLSHSAACSYDEAGNLLARFRTTSGGVTLTPSGDLVYVNADPRLEAYAPDGTVRWITAFDTPGFPVVDGNGTLFLVSNDGQGDTVAISSSNAVQWRAPLGLPVAMGADGTLYTVTNVAGSPSAISAIAP